MRLEVAVGLALLAVALCGCRGPETQDDDDSADDDDDSADDDDDDDDDDDSGSGDDDDDDTSAPPAPAWFWRGRYGPAGADGELTSSLWVVVTLAPGDVCVFAIGQTGTYEAGLGLLPGCPACTARISTLTGVVQYSEPTYCELRLPAELDDLPDRFLTMMRVRGVLPAETAIEMDVVSRFGDTERGVDALAPAGRVDALLLDDLGSMVPGFVNDWSEQLSVAGVLQSAEEAGAPAGDWQSLFVVTGAGVGVVDP